eukprot:TRINITY_DN9609_c0_g1_i1.p1 TRINITY_DN9609_c0_g1~~TRINITY_DN9609_c0_g1_i1.p1  ORF type:complete len:329 (-),score=48.65 TRINITY_DN9609_c0_g1_i1:475-1461(-)
MQTLPLCKSRTNNLVHDWPGFDNRQQGGNFNGRRWILPPSNVTNTRQEIYKPGDMPLESDYVEILPKKYYSDGTPLHLVPSVKTEEEAMRSEQVNSEHMNYWFGEPPKGGWPDEIKRVKIADTIEDHEFSPYHDEEEFVGDRFNFEWLEEGLEFMGQINGLYLDHGIKVDIHADIDGLIPCHEPHWQRLLQEGLYEKLFQGGAVKVRIHKVRDPLLYRWPIQLVLLKPDLQEYFLDPDEWEPPVLIGFHYSQDEITQLTQNDPGKTRELKTHNVYWMEDKTPEQIVEEWPEEVFEELYGKRLQDMEYDDRQREAISYMAYNFLEPDLL